jgi:hypothetical protein
MRPRVFHALATFVLALTPMTSVAQIDVRPTPSPTVTADNAAWFERKEPIFVAGNWYYPAGPQIHFIPNEMVRSGYYRGVPLYTRNTIEPYSIVYVPLSGGVMQPYERRRTGELAGTVGTTTPSFPVDRFSDLVGNEDASLPQAAGPPTGVALSPDRVPTLGSFDNAEVRTTTTTGRVESPPSRPPTSAIKPTGLNGVYIEYAGRKWFSRGRAVQLDATRFVVIGRYDGFPVYAERNGTRNTIYVPSAASAPTLLAPYSLRPF